MLVIVAVLSALVVACGGSEQAKTHETTFEDSKGESSAAGDIETVTVSNDALGVLKIKVRFAEQLQARPGAGERLAGGPVTAVSTSSITLLDEMTCAVPPAAAAEMSSVQIGDNVGIRCEKINGRWTLVSGDETSVVVYFDTDRNPATGARDFGAEYAFVVSRLREEQDSDFQGDVEYEFSLLRWDGASFDEPISGSRSSDARELAFELNSYDLGGATKGFDFAVATKHGSQPSVEQVGLSWPGPIDLDRLRTVDQAPDPGDAAWRFDLKVEPVEVSVAGFTTNPKTPKAGETISATTTVESSAAGDLGTALDGGCDATVDGELLTVGYGMGLTGDDDTTEVKAECHWDVPYDGVGKLFEGTVTLSYRGKSLTRSFSETIAP